MSTYALISFALCIFAQIPFGNSFTSPSSPQITVEVTLIYHRDDLSAFIGAIRYAAYRLTLQPASTTTVTVVPQSFVNPLSKSAAQSLKPESGEDASSKDPKIVFRESPTNFDNIFLSGDTICRLMEDKRLVFLIGFRLEHVGMLRSYSRLYNIPLILLDAGLDRPADTIILNNPSISPLTSTSDLSENPQSHFLVDPVTENEVLLKPIVLNELEALKLGIFGAAAEIASPHELNFGISLSAIIYKAMERKKWNSFYAIYDSEEGFRRLNTILKRTAMARRIVELKLRDVYPGTEADVVEELGKFHRDVSNILVDIRNQTTFKTFTKALKEYDLFTENVDYIFAGLNFDSDMEDIIAPLNLRTKDARMSGFHIVPRNDPAAPPEDTSYLEKILRNWRYLDSYRYPGSGSSRLTANQAFAVDFVALFAEAMKLYAIENPRSFMKLVNKSPNSRELTFKTCMGRQVPLPPNTNDLMDRLKQTSLPRSQTMSGHVQFNEQGERVNYAVYYHGQENIRIGFRHLGRYSDTNGFEYITAGEDRRRRLFTRKRPNWNRTRIITTIGVEPFLKLKSDAHRRSGRDRYEGYIADLSAAVAALAGFNYDLRLVADNAYGSINSTGQWNGMVGEVLDGIADMAIAPLTITAQREKVVDFSKPFMTLGISIMIKKPVKTKPSVFSFLDPLSYEIWLCIGFAYIGVSVVLYVVSRFSPYEWYEKGNPKGLKRKDEPLVEPPPPERFTIDVPPNSNSNTPSSNSQRDSTYQVLRHKPMLSSSSPASHLSTGSHISLRKLVNKNYTNDFNFPNALWFSLGAFMHQDVHFAPRSVSGRIVGSVWWFFTLIIISSYTANLAAFLTVERMSSPIESAEDLAKQTEIRYGTLRRGSTAQFFATSKSSAYQRMWAFMSTAEPTVFVDSIDEGIQRVRKTNGKYAFLLESTMNDYINSRKPCETMKVGINLDSKGYGVATPKGSDLKDAVNLAVLELREKGILQSLEKKWWVEKGECENSDSQQRKSNSQSQHALTLPKVAGVFYILIGGLALAMVASLCEFLHRAKMDARNINLPLGELVRQQTRKYDRSQRGASRDNSILGTMLVASKDGVYSTPSYGPSENGVDNVDLRRLRSTP